MLHLDACLMIIDGIDGRKDRHAKKVEEKPKEK